MGKTYGELLDVTVERFSSLEKFSRPIGEVNIDALRRVALIDGGVDAYDEASQLIEADAPKTSFVEVLGRRGVISVARTIALFGMFDGEEALRCLPWVADYGAHWWVASDLEDQADDIDISFPRVQKPLIAGYAVTREDGTEIIYDMVRLSEGFPTEHRHLLRDVSINIPDLHHRVKRSHSKVAESLDTFSLAS